MIFAIIGVAVYAYLLVIASHAQFLQERIDAIANAKEAKPVVQVQLMQAEAKPAPRVTVPDVDPFTVDDVLATLRECAEHDDGMAKHYKIAALQPDATEHDKKGAAAYLRKAVMIRYAASVVREKAAASVEAAR